MANIERDERDAIQALRDEWDHAIPVTGGPSPYASWLEREVVRLRRQHEGAVGALGRVTDMLARVQDGDLHPSRNLAAEVVRAQEAFARFGGR